MTQAPAVSAAQQHCLKISGRQAAVFKQIHQSTAQNGLHLGKQKNKETSKLTGCCLAQVPIFYLEQKYPKIIIILNVKVLIVPVFAISFDD